MLWDTDRYYLQMLLLDKSGAVDFDDLKTVIGIFCETAPSFALAKNSIQLCLSESFSLLTILWKTFYSPAGSLCHLSSGITTSKENRIDSDHTVMVIFNPSLGVTIGGSTKEWFQEGCPDAYRHSVLEQSTSVTLEGSDWTSESDITVLHIASTMRHSYLVYSSKNIL
ncbi:hypothetical protein AVEN_266078-1 [Araneus ventricosus]|uniref:Uncharacterized protein n=1 Tax=Araneus ventricosus TaxID=182803 RepID=A0A4Y2PF24_ARAVE|nr:hypothetical protein AVEN_266078-1 [Araneus ventricosus]